MAEIAKGIGQNPYFGGNNGPGLATRTPPTNSHFVVGDAPGIRGGSGSGAGERLMAVDACYISSAGVVMKAIEDQTGTNAAVNDVQTMSSTLAPGQGSIVSGTYVLGFRGAYTVPLNFNANAATVQTALQAVTTVGANNITVTGTFPNLVFTGAGTLAGQPLDVIEIGGSFSSDTGDLVAVTMAHTTTGRPVGAAGAEQAQSRVRGFTDIPYGRGKAVSLYVDVEFYYSDGLLTPGMDLYLSGTVPGGLADTATLTGQRPIAFAVDTCRIRTLGLR